MDDMDNGADQNPDALDVVLLLEDGLDAECAERVWALYGAQSVRYHVLLPYEDAAARVEAALTSLGSGYMLSSPVLSPAALSGTELRGPDLQEIQDLADQRTHQHLDAAMAALGAGGAEVLGFVVQGPPIDELAARIEAVGGHEAVVVTRHHVVAELLHLDWSAQARRRLGLPVHLVSRNADPED